MKAAGSGTPTLRCKAANPPLSVVVGGYGIALVLLTAGGVGVAAVPLLRQFADEQAARHVELAGRAAGVMVERYGDEALAASRVLADRPTLASLVQQGDRTGLSVFLAQFCAPVEHEGCAVLMEGEVLATAPPGYLPPLEAAPGLSVHRSPAGAASIVAVGELADGLTRTVVARSLGQDLDDLLSAHVGIPVRVLAGSEPAAAREPPWDDVDAIRQVETSRTPEWSGPPLLIQVALPYDTTRRSLRALLATLLGASALVVAIAAGGAVRLSRTVSRPVRGLSLAARRIGAGDLATPVQTVPGEELSALAATMEDMRRRLMRLTTDLRRSEAEAQSLLSGIVEGVFAVDEDRRVRYMNPQAAAILGVEAPDVMGRFCGDLLHAGRSPSERPCETQCPIVHARSRGSTRATETLHLRGGRRRSVVLTSSPPEGGRQVQIMRDETEIEGARRARDAIVGTVSHEFRTPLSAQLASLELLRERLQGRTLDTRGADPESVELVRALERSTLRLVQLVDNLLESVRLEAGEDSIRLGTVAIDEVIEEAVELMSPLLLQRSQRIELDLAYPLPELTGDAPRLIQVVVNLLANASKYAPEGTTVRIVAARHGAGIMICVEDEGPGLPPGSEGNIFNRFDRAGEPDTSGMGLGLWIVRSIVERHRGVVEAISLPGGGSRFTVRLGTEGST